MKPVEIKQKLFWTGVLHPDLRLFDILFPTEERTTSSSYLVKGEKPALIDAVKGRFYEQLLSNVSYLVEREETDYIVCNHMDPEHCGCVDTFLAESV